MVLKTVTEEDAYRLIPLFMYTNSLSIYTLITPEEADKMSDMVSNSPNFQTMENGNYYIIPNCGIH